MKLKELVAGEEALKGLVNAKFDNAQIAWDLADSLEVVEKTIKKFHDNRGEYIKANGVPIEGDTEQFKMEDQEAFTKFMVDLLEVEVDIVFPKLTVADLKDLKVSPSEIANWKRLGLIEMPKAAEAVEEVIEEAEVIEEQPKND